MEELNSQGKLSHLGIGMRKKTERTNGRCGYGERLGQDAAICLEKEAIFVKSQALDSPRIWVAGGCAPPLFKFVQGR